MVDIVFLLDRSGSICEAIEPGGATSWEYVLNFTIAMVNTLEIGPQSTQVALVLFGNFGYVQFGFGTYNTAEETNDYIRAIACKSENTNTTGGLWKARTEVFSDGRSDADRIMIMVTDGHPNREVDQLPSEVSNIESSGIKLIAIGTGGVDEDFLESLVQSPDNYFYILDYPDLFEVAEVVTLVACGGERPGQ